MSIVDKLTYLQTTKQLLKTEINKINNVLTDNSTFRSYPQELFNGYLDVLNNGTDTLWNNLEKVSASGETPVLENVETAPMKMVLNGNTSQDGTPTPDTPVEVKVVTGENVVSVQGKNLFDKSSNIVLNKYMGEDGTISGNSPRNWYQEDYIEVSNSTDYIISTTSSNYVRVAFYDDNKNFISRIVANGGIQISTTSSTKYLRLSGYDNLNDNIQLEQGSTATDFVPYSKTDYPINLGDIELCKINTCKDFPFKAINGNEYYDTLTEEQKNALNYGSWYVHKEINKVVFDGSESWVLSSLGAGKFYLEISPIFKMIGATARGIKPYSSHFVGKDNSLDFENGKVVLMTSSYGGTTHYFTRFENDNTPTLSEWKTWLSNNNVTLYYVLATPTEEEITNTTLIEQLEAISKAKSVKDKTYITQTNEELPFILDVEAIKEYEVI